VPRDGGGTTLTYKYDAEIGGKVASIGGRLLDGATRVIIGQFFSALAHRAGGTVDDGSSGLWARLRALFGGRQ
jgi:2-furoyl-CoA dehydrogenase large subunit